VLVCNTWLSIASEMQRSTAGSAWLIQASRPVVGRSRIVVSSRDRLGRSSARRHRAVRGGRMSIRRRRGRGVLHFGVSIDLPEGRRVAQH
jgi:hypothetical protein